MNDQNPYTAPSGAQPFFQPTAVIPPDAKLICEVPPPPDAPSVEFHLNNVDISQGLMFLRERNRWSWRARFIVFVLLLIPGGLTWLLHRISGPDVAAPYFATSAVIYFIAGLLLWIRYRNTHNLQVAVDWQVPTVALAFWHRVTVTPEYYMQSSGTDQSLTRWLAFVEIHEREHAIYVEQDLQQVHIIPRRAFANPTEYQRFVETARKYLERSKQDHPNNRALDKRRP